MSQKYVTCPTCKGKGQIPSRNKKDQGVQEDCPTCDGEGEVKA